MDRERGESASEMNIYESFWDYSKDWFDLIISHVLRFFASKDFKKYDAEIEVRRDVLRKKSKSAGVFIAFLKIEKDHFLTDLEKFCVMLSFLKKMNPGYPEIFRDLEIGEKKELSYDTGIRLYHLCEESPDIENYDFLLESTKNKLKFLGYKEENMEIPERLYEILNCNLDKPPIPVGFAECAPRDLKDEKLVIREKIAEKIKKYASLDYFSDKSINFLIYGEKGLGRQTLVKRAAKLAGVRLFTIDFEKIFTGSTKKSYDDFLDILSELPANNSFLCLKNISSIFNMEKTTETESVVADILSKANLRFQKVFVLLEEKNSKIKIRSDAEKIKIELESLSDEESAALWRFYLKKFNCPENIEVWDLTNKFRLTPLQIKNSAKEIKKEQALKENKKLKKDDIYKCVYNCVICSMDSKARKITKKHTWDDIILEESTKKELKKACDRIKFKHKVYGEWGFGGKISYGKGLSMLFHGASGAGKTMAAQVVASELGLELYKIDIARVISKYIGETEKNLKEIFEEAKKSNVILLFDEADALFAKRTEIKDSHDRNANIETSFLLQQMEDFDGITILTTNLDKNIDEAFKRRLTFKIGFSLLETVPGRSGETEKLKLKRALWEVFFSSKKLPLSDDINFSYLTTQFNISGGQMKNISLTAAFAAASEGSEKVTFKHILSAVLKETNYTRKSFGKYEYLLG